MLGLGNNLKKQGLTTPGIITDSLVLKHKYDAGAVVPVSDGAANFVASNTDYVDTGFIANYIHTNASFVAWVNMKDFVGTQLMGYHQDKRWYIGFSGTNGFIGVADSYKDDITISPSLSAGEWFHMAMTAIDGTATLYINGVAQGTDSYTQDAATNPDGQFPIGARLAASISVPMNAYICNVGQFNEGLTQAQIKSIMNKNYAGLTDSEKTNLVSWWNLDSTIISNSNGTENTAPAVVYDNHNTTLGSELVTNGDFSNDLTGWITGGTVVSVVNGISIIGSTGSDAYLYQTIGSVGDTFKLTFDLVVTSGVMRVGTNVDFQYSYSAGTYINESVYFTHLTENKLIFRRESGTVLATLDNVSLKQVNGNLGNLT